MLRDLLTSRVLAAASRAAAERPTPFYLFDPSELHRAVSGWRRAAREIGAEILYPYKCNRAKEVLEPLAAEGFGAEVATFADFEIARGLGVPGDRIVVHGPAKSVELIEAGLVSGAILAADGREDSLAILARARELAARPRYLLRLAPEAASAEQRPFGLPAGRLLSLARELSRRREPPPEGLAFHLDTGIASPRPYLAALEEAVSVWKEIQILGLSMSVLDLGGGFAAEGESRRHSRARAGVSGGGATMLAPIGAKARHSFGAGIRLLLEPGRALVSGSLHLVARVVRVKAGRRGATIYLDASRLSHAFWVGWGKHPVAAIPRRRGATRNVALAGPLGVGLDLFDEAVRLPPLAPGDLVVIGSVGAYNWNSANAWAGPVPPIVEASSLAFPRRRRSRGKGVPTPSPSGRGLG
jgi:diaminopimelate decarboxylase